MATVGELSDFSVADLMTVLSQRKRTGRLVIKAAGNTVAMYFDAGHLVRVTSGDIALRLGRMLVRQGLLDTARLLEALHMQSTGADAIPLGEVLIRKGWITEPDLQRCLEEQSIEVLSKVMSSGPGMFTFDADLVVDCGQDMTPLEPMSLLQIAEERTAALAVLQERLPDHLSPIYLNVPSSAISDMQAGVGPAESIVLGVLRTGPKTYPELSVQSALDELSLGVAVITLLEDGTIASTDQLSSLKRQSSAGRAD